MNEKEIFRQINDQRLLFMLLNFISQNLVKSLSTKIFQSPPLNLMKLLFHHNTRTPVSHSLVEARTASN